MSDPFDSPFDSPFDLGDAYQVDLGMYTLIGQTPVKEPDPRRWAMWMESARDQRHVGLDDIPGGVVSTVFLGLDHDHLRQGPPLLFETMVFLDGEPDYMARSSTWLEAEAQHRRILARYAAGSSSSDADDSTSGISSST